MAAPRILPPRQGEKDDALRHALFLNSPTFVELAVAHGASIAAIPFLDVLMTGDRALVAAFFEKGHQLRAKTTLGSYLDCRRSRPNLVEHLQQQADFSPALCRWRIDSRWRPSHSR
jgi:hypothetical protein